MKLLPTQRTTKLVSLIIPSTRDYVEQWELSHITTGMQNGSTTLENFAIIY